MKRHRAPSQIMSPKSIIILMDVYVNVFSLFHISIKSEAVRFTFSRHFKFNKFGCGRLKYILKFVAAYF